MNPKNATKPIEILLVEDSPADILITREAFQDARLFKYDSRSGRWDTSVGISAPRRKPRLSAPPRPDPARSKFATQERT